MSGVRYRLTRAFGGTVAVTLGMVLVVMPAPFLVTLSPAWSLTGLIVKMLMGALVFAKGLEQYEKASFPPGTELQDPIGSWIQNNLEALKKKAWPLWLLAICLLMFTPILTAVFLPFVLLRPFHATIHSDGPYGEVLLRELKQTGSFLLEMGKGLLVLTLCSCLALGSSLVILLGAIWMLRAS